MNPKLLEELTAVPDMYAKEVGVVVSVGPPAMLLRKK